MMEEKKPYGKDLTIYKLNRAKEEVDTANKAIRLIEQFIHK